MVNNMEAEPRIELDYLSDPLSNVPSDLRLIQDANPKTAFGIKKPSMHLIPGTALMMLAKVMALGAKKYGAFNWRVAPVPASVYVSALFRHVYQWFDGEDIDPESGAPHLAHAMACLTILLDAAAQGTLIDDRPTAGKTDQIIKELSE